MPLADGVSSILLSEFNSTDVLTAVADENEHVLGGAIQFGGAYPIRWNSLPVAQVRVGFACRFVVTGASWTVRIRVGGTPNFRETVAGTIVHTFVVPIGTTVVDELTALITHPANTSYIMITAEADGPGGNIQGNGATTFIVPDAIGVPALALATQQSFLHSGTSEIVRGQWLVDFDEFDGDNVFCGLAGRTYTAAFETVTVRLRIGGTFLGNDGTVVCTLNDAYGAYDGHLAQTSGTVAKPTGVQLVKVSVQSTGGFAAELHGMSVLFLEA